MVGTHAGDMIGEIALAIEMGADAVDIGKTIHPHPKLGESIGMAAEVAHGSCTDLPPVKNNPVGAGNPLPTQAEPASTGAGEGALHQHAGRRCRCGTSETRRWAMVSTLRQIGMKRPNRHRMMRSISVSVGEQWRQRFCQRSGGGLRLPLPK